MLMSLTLSTIRYSLSATVLSFLNSILTECPHVPHLPSKEEDFDRTGIMALLVAEEEVQVSFGTYSGREFHCSGHNLRIWRLSAPSRGYVLFFTMPKDVHELERTIYHETTWEQL